MADPLREKLRSMLGTLRGATTGGPTGEYLRGRLAERDSILHQLAAILDETEPNTVRGCTLGCEWCKQRIADLKANDRWHKEVAEGKRELLKLEPKPLKLGHEFKPCRREEYCGMCHHNGCGKSREAH